MRHVQFQQDMTDLRLLLSDLRRVSDDWIAYAATDEEEEHNRQVERQQDRLSSGAMQQERKLRAIQVNALANLGLTRSD
jgi:hypothetical protein